LFRSGGDRYTITNRAVVIEQLKQTQDPLAKLLALLEAGEHTSLPHTYTSRVDYIGAPPTDRKGRQGYRVGRSLNLPKTAELGFNGEFHVWEHLLRIHD
jgi:hypothetical protein